MESAYIAVKIYELIAMHVFYFHSQKSHLHTQHIARYTVVNYNICNYYDGYWLSITFVEYNNHDIPQDHTS